MFGDGSYLSEAFLDACEDATKAGEDTDDNATATDANLMVFTMVANLFGI